jgi:hypothetical protein
MGIGLARMKENRLYKDLGFRSITGYIEKLCTECKMERSSVFTWLGIGEAYLKHQTELEKIGFDDRDGPTKLPFIDRALLIKEKDEVFENVKKMSGREFKDFSKSRIEIDAIDKRKVTVRGNKVFIGDKQAITLSEDMNRRTYDYFRKVILIAGKALQEGGVLLPVHLADMDEARRYENAVYSLIDEMRRKSA